MSPETIATLAKMKKQKTVWCQHGKMPGSNMDEHQVCLDVGYRYEKEHPGKKWSCPCSCHA